MKHCSVSHTKSIWRTVSEDALIGLSSGLFSRRKHQRRKNRIERCCVRAARFQKPFSSGHVSSPEIFRSCRIFVITTLSAAHAIGRHNCIYLSLTRCFVNRRESHPKRTAAARAQWNRRNFRRFNRIFVSFSVCFLRIIVFETKSWRKMKWEWGLVWYFQFWDWKTWLKINFRMHRCVFVHTCWNFS